MADVKVDLRTLLVVAWKNVVDVDACKEGVRVVSEIGDELDVVVWPEDKIAETAESMLKEASDEELTEQLVLASLLTMGYSAKTYIDEGGIYVEATPIEPLGAMEPDEDATVTFRVREEFVPFAAAIARQLLEELLAEAEED